MDLYHGPKGSDYRRYSTPRERTLRQGCCPVSPPSSPLFWSEPSPLAMAYVPMQPFQNLYDMEKALQRGTLFSELDFPFEIGFCARGCGCQ